MPSGSTVRRWGALALPIAIALATHAPGLTHPLSIDDGPILREHPDVVEDAGLWRLWTQNYWGPLRPGAHRTVYRPLAILAFHASTRLTGAAPVPERAINLALLAIVAALVAAWTAGHAPLPLAALAGATVALHPQSASQIQQIVQRADLLAWIGALAAALVARGAARAGRWSWARSCALGAVAFVAFGTKETGTLAIPLVLATIAHEGAPGRRLRLAAGGMLALAPAFALMLAGRVLALGGLTAASAVYDLGPQANPLEPLPYLERAPGAFAVALDYARLVVWPDPSFYHHPDTPPGWGAPTAAGLALLLLGLALAIRGLARRTPSLLPLVAALANYAVVGNLLFRVGVYTANRLALPFTSAAAMLIALAAARAWRRGRRARVAIALALVLMDVALGARTWASYACWSSATEVFANDHARRPADYAPLAVYAIAMETEAHYAEALPLLAQAIARRPDHPQAMIARGEALVHLGQRDQATAEFERALGLADPHPIVRYHQLLARVNLAALALASGDLDAAAIQLAAADAIDPGDARVLHNRAALAFARGDDDAVAAVLVELARRWPRYEPGRRMQEQMQRLWRERGADHFRAERWGAARADLARARVLDPAHVPTAFGYAQACAKEGDRPAAIAGYDRVLALQPEHALAHAYRGVAWLAAGDAGRALVDLERALALEPRLTAQFAPSLATARAGAGSVGSGR